MKRVIIYISIIALILFGGCENPFRDEFISLQEKIDNYKGDIDKANSNLASIGGIVEELQNGGYVKDYVELFEDGERIGYTLIFSDDKSFNIYNGKDGQNGSDGHTPTIGVKQDSDGKWCWTIDGEWLKDENGNKIIASSDDGPEGANGLTPKLIIEGGYWYISYDNEQSWCKIDKASGRNGEDGVSFFKNVNVDGDTVLLTLADGTIIAVPKNTPFKLTLSDNMVELAGGETYSVSYTLSGLLDNCVVAADCSSDYWQVEVEKEDNEHGLILITAPNRLDKSQVTVWASNGTFTTMSAIVVSVESDGNLSAGGTANCYIVTKAGNFCFDASVMGNGAEGFLWSEIEAAKQLLWPHNAASTDLEVLYANDNIMMPYKAMVVWDEGGVISDVKYNKRDKTISFTATGNKGSALIGLYNRYAFGPEWDEVLWSWHIWCTDLPQDMLYYDIEGNQYLLMDRNIGAISANPADGRSTYGYYFQWGRPSPLRAYIGMAQDFIPCEQEMRIAISHPASVYKAGTHTVEWFNTGKGALSRITADLWGNPRHKFATVGEYPIDHHPYKSDFSTFFG